LTALEGMSALLSRLSEAGDTVRTVLILLATGAPHRTEVVIAVFGASAGVGGLVLVFLGILITTVGTYPGGTSDAVLRPYRRAAWASVGVFALSLLTVAVSLIWLSVDQSHSLYVLTLVVFSSVLAAVLALAGSVTKATV
jgi:hypothetical protein